MQERKSNASYLKFIHYVLPQSYYKEVLIRHFHNVIMKTTSCELLIDYFPEFL
jgi:hypothetical protein